MASEAPFADQEFLTAMPAPRHSWLATVSMRWSCHEITTHPEVHYSTVNRDNRTGSKTEMRDYKT